MSWEQLLTQNLDTIELVGKMIAVIWGAYKFLRERKEKKKEERRAVEVTIIEIRL